MSLAKPIEKYDDDALNELCEQLAARCEPLVSVRDWPDQQLDLCARYGVFRWFMPTQWHGYHWNDVDTVRGYLRLSAACLTTTFVITQRTGACRRIEGSDNASIKSQLLPELISGRSFATVGISHLTTSRRHLQRPALRATETRNGFVLDGMSPWVTGAPFAQNLVVGATLEDATQILTVVPTDLTGVEIRPSEKLVALSASRTGQVEFHGVSVDREFLLSGPVENVMAQGIGANTGGLQTSTLALGLSRAAIDYLQEQSRQRQDLHENTSALEHQWQQTVDDLLTIASGTPVCTNDQLRTRANSLVLRCTQSALMAAKGAGYVADHRVGRWCREALFFLVWSCPQPVMSANMCELAGIDS